MDHKGFKAPRVQPVVREPKGQEVHKEPSEVADFLGQLEPQEIMVHKEHKGQLEAEVPKG